MDINKTSPGTMPRLADCRQKAILPTLFGGRIALSANERIAEFLDFAIQAKLAYVNKLKRAPVPCRGSFDLHMVFMKGDYAIFQLSAKSVFSHGISLAFSPKWP